MNDFGLLKATDLPRLVSHASGDRAHEFYVNHHSTVAGQKNLFQRAGQPLPYACCRAANIRVWREPCPVVARPGASFGRERCAADIDGIRARRPSALPERRRLLLMHRRR